MAAVIAIHPVGDPTPDLGEGLSQELSRVLERPVRRGQALPIPPVALNARRQQYSAAEILYAMQDVMAAGEMALGITDVDLYVPGEDFVFGQSAPGIGAAVLSLYRLHPDPPDEALLFARALKEAAHEVGHLSGLRHCRRRSCIMYPSSSVESTDKKDSRLCSACGEKLTRKAATA